MNTIRTLILVVLAMIANTTFGQDLVGKIPTQERKIKISQLEERSNRVPPTAAIWQQYAKANNKAEQRAVADKALAMLYSDAAFYSYINNETLDAAVVRFVGYVAEISEVGGEELKGLQSSLLEYIQSVPVQVDADTLAGNILYNKRVYLERDTIPVLLKGCDVAQLLQQCLTAHQWRKFNNINRLHFHNMTSALSVLERYYDCVIKQNDEIVRTFGQSKVMSAIKEMIVSGELTIAPVK